QMKHALRPGVGKESSCVVPVREVVVRAPRDVDVVTAGFQALDEVRSEKAAAACDEDLHAGARVCVNQSTRPIQRGRFSANQAIVRATPSSHETCGSQP